jgi:hypothetical protein
VLPPYSSQVNYRTDPLNITVRRSAATIQLSGELENRPLAHHSKAQCCHHTALR